MKVLVIIITMALKADPIELPPFFLYKTIRLCTGAHSNCSLHLFAFQLLTDSLFLSMSLSHFIGISIITTRHHFSFPHFFTALFCSSCNYRLRLYSFSVIRYPTADGFYFHSIINSIQSKISAPQPTLLCYYRCFRVFT